MGLGHSRRVARRPLSREELESKFRGNTTYGQWSDDASARLLAATRSLYDGPVELSAFRPD